MPIYGVCIHVLRMQILEASALVQYIMYLHAYSTPYSVVTRKYLLVHRTQPFILTSETTRQTSESVILSKPKKPDVFHDLTTWLPAPGSR